MLMSQMQALTNMVMTNQQKLVEQQAITQIKNQMALQQQQQMAEEQVVRKRRESESFGGRMDSRDRDTGNRGRNFDEGRDSGRRSSFEDTRGRDDMRNKPRQRGGGNRNFGKIICQMVD